MKKWFSIEAMASVEGLYFSFSPGISCVVNSEQRLSHLTHAFAAIIVHGRYDTICPLINAWQLHKAWPESQLNIIPATGHSAFEPGNIDALVKATDHFSSLLKGKL